MSQSPTARTLQLLPAAGYLAAVVERRVHGRLTIDLFGIADVLAVHPGHKDVLLIQVTTRGHQAARVARVRAPSRAEALPALLRAGLRVEVWAWSPPPKGRGRRKCWECIKRPVGLGSIPAAEV
jgi:hypothetical protein